MIAALSQLGKQWSAKPQRFLTKCIYDLWLVYTHADTFKHSDTRSKHSSLLLPPSTASHDPLFAQDRPLGLAVAPLSMSTPVLAQRPHGPVGSGRAGQRSRSQNGPVSSLVPGSSGAERGGFVYFQYVFITESKGCSWATRLWRQRAIVARRPDHSEIAELTGTGAVARQTEQAKFTLATELTHLIMIDHCRQKTKQPTHGKCLWGKKWEHASRCQKSRLLCSCANWQTSKQDKPPRRPQNKTPTQTEWGDWGRKRERRAHMHKRREESRENGFVTFTKAQQSVFFDGWGCLIPHKLCTSSTFGSITLLSYYRVFAVPHQKDQHASSSPAWNAAKMPWREGKRHVGFSSEQKPSHL